jgi:outer membrane protein OmpA-like peptidoglycan-associated protein/osmotically-inducible protein OsmY
MRTNPWRWLWGLIPIIALGWIAVQVEHAKIERDLERRVKSALVEAKLGWADVSFSGRDGLLTGKAMEEGDPAKALETALATWGVRVVVDKTSLIDKASRYEWTAMRRDNRIRINGLVPGETTRREVIGIVKASFPTLEVDDRMRLARGAPPTDTWLGGVGFAIRQLAQLKSGQVDLQMTELSVTGEALDSQAYAGIIAALSGRLPPGISLRSENVTPPTVKPHVWSAKRANDRLVLGGHVPSDKARRDMVEVERARGADKKVVDEMRYGGGEAEGWEAATAAALAALAWAEEGSAELRDGVLTVSVLAQSEEKAEAARKELEGRIPASIKLSPQIRAKAPVVPTINPYRTAARLEQDTLALTGHAPAEDLRQAVVAFARQQFGANVRVLDDLELGLGQPAGWRKCFETGLATLARLGNGSASLVDRQLQIVGRSEAADLARALPDRVRSAVGEDCDADVRITLAARPEPQLKWSATLQEDGALVLSGSVAGKEARDQITQAAAKLFPKARLEDRMSTVDDASEKWAKTASQALVLLSRLRHGEAQLVGQELTISGEAGEAGTQEAIRRAIGSDLPQGYRGREAVSLRVVPPPTESKEQEPTSAIVPKSYVSEERTARAKPESDECEKKLQSASRWGVIRFDRASARLDRADYPKLMRLVEVARSCKRIRLEIAGHTDDDGLFEENQFLSELRALSVADFLAREGVDPRQIETIGFADTRPIAPNTTERNKAMNRRIEFRLRVE